MRLPIIAVLSALPLLLSGCATTISSQVIAFHDWPATLPEKTFVFEPPATQAADLEYLSYQKLVAAELHRLGLMEAQPADIARLRVAFDYNTNLRNVVISQAVRPDPFMRGFVPYSFRSHGLRQRGYFYDPFWMDWSGVEYYQWETAVFQRQIHIKISEVSGNKKLYEATVDNAGMEPATATIMPYLIQSAFIGFPGKSGIPHQVNLKVKTETN